MAKKKNRLEPSGRAEASVLDIYSSAGAAFSPEDKKYGRKIYLILCFLLPFLFLGFCFAINSVVPFGDRTIFYADFKAQYYPFLQEFQSKLQNGDSLFWTWTSGLGCNFISLIGYYISSPMNLLLAVIPSSFLVEAVTLFVLAKFGFAGLFCGVFIKKVFKRNDISLVAFSACYVFCDFMMGYYWNIIWLDTVALLPLVALGVYNLVYLGKYKLYIVSLALAMISNYYIGYMVCLFTFFWFFMLWIKRPSSEGSRKDLIVSLVKIGIYSAVAIAMAAFILLPTALQLGNSASSNSTGIGDFEIYKSFFEIMGNSLGFHNATKIDGLPNIYCGLICLVLFTVFLRSNKIRRVEKIVDCAFAVFLYLSFNISWFDILWHGFHEPNQIPGRFSFVFAFMMIIISYRAFTLLKYLKPVDFALMGGFSLVFVLCAIFYESKGIVLSVCFILGYMAILFMYHKKVYGESALTVIISVAVIAEMYANCYSGVKFVGTADVNYPSKNEQVRSLLDYADSVNTENDFYRIDQTYLSSKNDGVWYGYNGVGQFSSTVNKNVLNFTSDIGVISSKLSFQGYHTSPLAESFLNIKYLISRDGFMAEDRSFSAAQTADGVTLFENNYYLPIAFMVNSTFETFDTNQYSSVFEAQNDLFRKATGLSGDLFTLVDLSGYSASSGTVSPNGKSGNFTYDLGSKNKTADIFYNAPKAGQYYAYTVVRSDTKNVTVKNDDFTHKYDVDAKRFIFPVGDLKQGEKLSFSFEMTEAAKGNFELYTAYFDSELFAEGIELLKDEGIKLSSYSDAGMEGTVTAKTDGLLYTSIPNEDGWEVYVDGQKADKFVISDTFVGVKLTAGEHTVKFAYVPKGLIPGIAISVIALLAFAALIIFDRIKNKKQEQKL